MRHSKPMWMLPHRQNSEAPSKNEPQNCSAIIHKQGGSIKEVRLDQVDSWPIKKKKTTYSSYGSLREQLCRSMS